MTSQLDMNKKVVYRWIDECWNEGSVATVPQLVTANCHYHDPVFPHMVAGVESMQHHIERCRRAFPDLKLTITDTIAERDEVVVHWTLNGTHRGEFLGIAPTHVNTLVAGTSIYRLEDGKIAEQWWNWNLMSLMEQLGIRTAPWKTAEAKAHA